MRKHLIASGLLGFAMPAMAGAPGGFSDPSAVRLAPPPQAAAFADTIGGRFGISYGDFTILPNSDAFYRTGGNSFQRYELNGSVGKRAASGFGWQADALYETATGSAGSEYNFYGITGHANYALGPVRLGGFVGTGATDNTYLFYKSSNSWYGVEAVGDIGNFSIAAQIGAGNANFGDASLDYTGKSFYQIEARYYINDFARLSAHYGEGMGRLRSDDLSVTQYGVEAMVRLGRESRFLATAGYEHNFTNGDLNRNFRGQGRDETYWIGITAMFGGGLKDTFRTRTPMLAGNIMLLPGLNGGVWSD